jgi:hypothetical protein
MSSISQKIDHVAFGVDKNRVEVMEKRKNFKSDSGE